MTRYTFAKGLIVAIVITLGAFATFTILRILTENFVTSVFGVESELLVYGIILLLAILILAIGFRFKIKKILERFLR